jgi:catalase (peroxidase I)
VAVAQLFAGEAKIAKARKWFARATALDAALGDAWAGWHAFEKSHGDDKAQRVVRQQAIAAEPNKGFMWCAIAKRTAHRRKPIAELFDIVVGDVMEGRAVPGLAPL